MGVHVDRRPMHGAQAEFADICGEYAIQQQLAEIERVCVAAPMLSQGRRVRLGQTWEQAGALKGWRASREYEQRRTTQCCWQRMTAHTVSQNVSFLLLGPLA